MQGLSFIFLYPGYFVHLYIHQYLLCFNFWKLVPKSSFSPFVAKHITLLVLQESFPFFAYLTGLNVVFIIHLFRLKLIMKLTLDHLCSKWNALQRKHFDEAVSSFLESCTKYLLNNLPFDNQIIKYARFFQPSLLQSIAAPNAISRKLKY